MNTQPRRTRKALGSALVAVCTLSVGGCADRPDDWSPVLEETSTAFLENETERVLSDISAAMDQLPENPVGAETSLAEAERSLDYLKTFYLPLFRARERAYNAFRYFRLEDHAQVIRELGSIERTLASMVDAADGGLLTELEKLAEAAADARIAVEAGPEEGGDALENLARLLNQAALKGDLILH